MRNVSDKSRENQNTHFIFSNNFPRIEPFVGYCGKNIVERGRPQMIACRMRIAGRIPKVTDKHSDYVILFPFPLKQ